MKFPRVLALAVLFSVSSVLRADEGEVQSLTISTLSGRTYSDCKIVQEYPDGVTFRYHGGMAKVLFSDMTPGSRSHFGYDAAKLGAYERKVREDRVRAQEAAAARAADVQKAWAEAYAEALHAEAVENQGAFQGGYGGAIGWLDAGLGSNANWNGNGYYGSGHPWRGTDLGSDVYLRGRRTVLPGCLGQGAVSKRGGYVGGKVGAARGTSGRR